MDNGAIVELANVVKTYRQGKVDVHAVNDLSLTVKKGEFTSLVGPSGSGKTTTLNMIGALDVPTKGTVTVEGRNIADMDGGQLSAMRRDRIGFIFQAYNLVPVLTAYENAELVLALQGAPEEERHDRVMRILDEVGLKGMEHRRPNELSGGQQQRVAIARAIVTRPAVVLADEPTANVDSHTADELLDLMQMLNKEEQTTFIFSTHDQRVVDRARRVVTLKDGALETDEQRDGRQG